MMITLASSFVMALEQYRLTVVHFWRGSAFCFDMISQVAWAASSTLTRCILSFIASDRRSVVALGVYKDCLHRQYLAI